MVRSRRARVRAAVRRSLRNGEQIATECDVWACVRRRAPLLLTGRHQYHLVLTNSRVIAVTRTRRRRIRGDDLALAKRYQSLRVTHVRRGFPLLHVRVRTDTGVQLVLEFGPRSWRIGWAMVAAIQQATPPAAV